MSKGLMAAVGVLLACGFAPMVCGAGTAKRPNILLITADDLGNQLSCYGETRIRTPRLDALAAEGVRFANAYVTQASCSSSRSSLLTGLYAHQNGQYGLAHLGFSMHGGRKALPALLKAAGYHNGIIGKLHVEPAADFPFDWTPREKGPLRTRQVRWVAQQSREFFAKAKAAGRPFFYYVNYFDPHGPYNAEAAQVEGLPERPLKPEAVTPLEFKSPDPQVSRRVTAIFYDCVLRVDAGVGLLLDELAAAGLAGETLVVFLGDNGAPVHRGKTTCYEMGVQVPLVIRWPGVTKPAVRTELVSMVDVMPTLLQAAGAAMPEGLAGEPLQPLLGSGKAAWREMLFTEMNFHAANTYYPQRSVRDQRYKLLLNLQPEEGQAGVELFDLAKDPGETKNLAEDRAMAGQRSRLEAALQAWREKTADPLLDPARRARWSETAARWKTSAPRLGTGPYANVKLVPPGELERLK